MSKTLRGYYFVDFDYLLYKNLLKIDLPIRTLLLSL